MEKYFVIFQWESIDFFISNIIQYLVFYRELVILKWFVDNKRGQVCAFHMSNCSILPHQRHYKQTITSLSPPLLPIINTPPWRSSMQTPLKLLWWRSGIIIYTSISIKLNCYQLWRTISPVSTVITYFMIKVSFTNILK